MTLGNHALRDERIRALGILLRAKAGKKPGNIAAAANEIQRLPVGTVMEAPLFFRVRAKDIGFDAVRSGCERGHALMRIAARCDDQPPIERNAAQDSGLSGREYLAPELFRRRRLPLADWGDAVSS
jgi:hypothetical protein